MTALAAKRPALTYDQYLALEEETGRKHEFLDGEAWMMSGGTPRHSALKTNLLAKVFNALDVDACRPYDSDLKVRVAATGLSTYPDLTIVCGGIERHPEDQNAVINPTALFEVLSASTERWDRGSKFQHYQQIASLQHYVLVDQVRPRLEVFTRGDDGAWSYRTYGAGDVVALPAAGLSLEVDALYRNLPDVAPAEAASAEPSE